jgi:hypothetical protein
MRASHARDPFQPFHSSAFPVAPNRPPQNARQLRSAQEGKSILSFETRKQAAEKVLRRWQRSNQSPAAQKRLINDGERAWMLARDLAEALDNLLGHARSVQHGYLAVARRRWPAAEWIIGDGRYASVARCGTVTRDALRHPG